MSGLPHQYYREPAVQGKPGRLFARHRFSLTVKAEAVVRTAPYSLGVDADFWANRTIRAEFKVPGSETFGLIDSYGFANDLTNMSGAVIFYRTLDNDFAGRPYLIGAQLTFDVQLSSAGFSWLWGEIQNRNGELELQLSFPILMPEGDHPANALRADKFVDADPRDDERDDPIGFAMTVSDRL